MIRLLIADDHAIVRAGIRALLDSEPDLVVVGEAADGPGAVEAAARTLPDVVLMDLMMPGGNGVEAIIKIRQLGELRTCSPRTRVLVLSMHEHPGYARNALRAGACGYMVKGRGLEDLVAAIRAVDRGERYLAPEVRGALSDHPLEHADDLSRLTPREREVLRLVAEGRTNREIGVLLGLSSKTVDTHRTSVMRKLDLHDAPALTRFALSRGLLPPE